MKERDILPETAKLAKEKGEAKGSFMVYSKASGHSPSEYTHLKQEYLMGIPTDTISHLHSMKRAYMRFHGEDATKYPIELSWIEDEIATINKKKIGSVEFFFGEACGIHYPLEVILANLSTEEIAETIHEYAVYYHKTKLETKLETK